MDQDRPCVADGLAMKNLLWRHFSRRRQPAAAPAAFAQQSTHSTQNAQQERMKSCNTQAGAQKLAGDARKTFMSSCLKGS